MNSKQIQQIQKDSLLDVDQFSELLGLTRHTYYNRIRGQSQFTENHILMIRKIREETEVHTREEAVDFLKHLQRVLDNPRQKTGLGRVRKGMKNLMKELGSI